MESPHLTAGSQVEILLDYATAPGVQAIEGARRYFSCVLSNLNQPGVLPDPLTYQYQAVAVGEATETLPAPSTALTV